MKEKSTGGIIVVLFVSIIALGCGAFCGMNDIGEDFSKDILPTSLTSTSEYISPINESTFVPATIDYQKFIPKENKVVQTNKTDNNTNKTTTTSNNTDNKKNNDKKNNSDSSSERNGSENG